MLTGVIAPRIYMLHVTQLVLDRPALIQGQITPVEGMPADVTVGQVVFAPDNTGVVVTAWSHTPRKLGLQHYNTRASGIYYIPFTSAAYLPTLAAYCMSHDSAAYLPIAAANTVAGDDRKGESKEQEDRDKRRSETSWIYLTPQDHSPMYVHPHGCAKTAMICLGHHIVCC